MPTLVDVPEVGRIEFPDGMSNDDIKATIRRKFYSPAEPLGLKTPRQPASGEMSTTYGGKPKPVASLSETLAEPMQEMANTRFTAPRLKIEPADSIPVAVGKEAVNIAASIPEFFSSNLGVGSVVAGAAAPTATAAAFTADMLHSLGTQVRDTYKNWDTMDRNQKVAAVTDIAGTGAFAALTGHATVKGLKPADIKLKSQSSVIADVAPLTAKAVETQPEILKPATPETPKGTEDASQITAPAEVHGDVRPLEEPARELPVAQSGEGIQPQAEGRLPGAQEPQAPAKPDVAEGSNRGVMPAQIRSKLTELTVKQSEEIASISPVEANKKLAPDESRITELRKQIKSVQSQIRAKDKKMGSMTPPPIRAEVRGKMNERLGKLQDDLSSLESKKIQADKDARAKENAAADKFDQEQNDLVSKIEAGEPVSQADVDRLLQPDSEWTKRAKIISHTQPKEPPPSQESSIVPTVGEKPPAAGTVKEVPASVKRKLPIGFDESTARMENGKVVVRQKPDYGGKWMAVDVRKGTAEPYVETEAPPPSDAPPEQSAAKMAALKDADEFTSKAAVVAERATVDWAKHVEDVVNPIKAQIRKIESEVLQMAADAKRTLPETKGKSKLTQKKFLEMYGVASIDEANAIYEQKRVEWSDLEKQLEAAESKRKDLELAKERRAKEWSSAATRAGELRRDVYPKVREGDVGKEASAPIAKVEKQIEKVAETEGQRPAKEVKSELVSRLETAVSEATANTDDYFPGLYVVKPQNLSSTFRITDRPVEHSQPLKDWLGDSKTRNDKTPNRETQLGKKFIAEALERKKVSKVTIDIPGDGTFTVWNTKDALQSILDKARAISTKPSEPTKIRKSGISKEDKAFVEEQLANPQKASEIIGMGGAVPEDATSGKYRIKNEGPQTYSIVERLPASDIEKENGEQPIRVKNDRTGAQSTVLEAQLHQVKDRTGEEKAKPAKESLDDQLRAAGMDPSVFRNAEEKRAALKRNKAKNISEGPGAASPGDVPQSPQEKQLMDSLDALPAGTDGRDSPTISIADRIAETIDTGKDVMSKWWLRTKAGAEQYKRLLFGAPRTEDAFWSVKKDWTANRQVNAGVAKEMIDRGRKLFPKQLHRQAMGKYAQSLMFDDPEGMLSQWAADAKKPSNRAQYEAALHLTDEQKTTARRAVQYWESKGRELQDAGLLKNLVEDYAGQHMVDIRGSKPPAELNQLKADLVRGTFNTNFKYALRRMFETEFDLEQAGYKLKTTDIFDKLANYAKTANDVLADRSAIRRWMDGETPNGKPLFATGQVRIPIEGDSNPVLLVNPKVRPNPVWKGPGGEKVDIGGEYIKVDHPAFRKWQWAEKTSDGKEIYVQGDVWAHRSIADELKNSMGRSRLYDIPGVDTITRTNAQLKGIKLVGFFHQVKTGSHALFHLTNPWGQPKVDPHDGFTYDAMRAGLQLFEANNQELFSEGAASGSLLQGIANLPKTVTGVDKLGFGDYLRAYQEYLFQDYIPRIKLATYRNALQRNLERYPELDPNVTRQVTATQINSAFGEMNWRLLGVNPTFRHFLRLSLLAPDFQSAQHGFAAQIFTKYGGEQRMAAAIMIGSVYTGARVLNQLLDKDPHWEPKRAFSVVYGKREFGIRTIASDAQRAFTDTSQYFYHRLSPIASSITEGLTRVSSMGQKETGSEAMKNIALRAVPIPLTPRSDIGFIESAISSTLGIYEKKYTAISDINALAHDWRKKNDPKYIDAAVQYPPSVYGSLRTALESDDTATAKKEYDKLRKSRTAQEIEKAMGVRETFGGMSAANMAKFKRSLSPEQLKTLERAMRERKDLARKFHELRTSGANTRTP